MIFNKDPYLVCCSDHLQECKIFKMEIEVTLILESRLNSFPFVLQTSGELVGDSVIL